MADDGREAAAGRAVPDRRTARPGRHEQPGPLRLRRAGSTGRSRSSCSALRRSCPPRRTRRRRWRSSTCWSGTGDGSCARSVLRRGLSWRACPRSTTPAWTRTGACRSRLGPRAANAAHAGRRVADRPVQPRGAAIRAGRRSAYRARTWAPPTCWHLTAPTRPGTWASVRSRTSHDPRGTGSPVWYSAPVRMSCRGQGAAA